MKAVVLQIILGLAIFANVQSQDIETADIQAKDSGAVNPYYQWSAVHFNFSDPELEEKLVKNNSLIQKNVLINGVKISGNKMFLSLPRYLNGGVPVTFAVVDYKPNQFLFGFKLTNYPTEKSPKLTPYPSYEMQEEGNCKAFQLAQSMDLDQFDRLWIPDPGRTNLLTPTPKNNCPAKLVVIDTKTNKTEFTYTFPEDVVSPTQNAIKDISVACTTKTDCWVYISDLFGGKIIVYDVKNNQSWSATHPTMLPDKTTMNFTIGDTNVSAPFGVTGQFLSPKSDKFSKLYFSSISSTKLYVIKTDILKNPALKKNNTLKNDDVKLLGEKKGGQSDGMTMNSGGDIFYGALPESAVYKTRVDFFGNKLSSFSTSRIAQSDDKLSWPDTFGFDGDNNLAITATTFQKFQAGTLSDTAIRYYIDIFYGAGRASNTG